MTDNDEQTPFVDAVAMELDPSGYFVGDRGVLEPEVRRVLALLLKKRFLLAEGNSDDWNVLLENQQVIESRLHDLFLNLVVDRTRGVAYKEQVRSEELDIPILLRDDAYTRSETLVLVYLRTVYQRETVAGETSPRVDAEEVESTVLSYFANSDGDMAGRQRTVQSALTRLSNEGIIVEESAQRYRIRSLIEIILSAARLRELSDWLETQTLLDENTDGIDEAEEVAL